MPSTANECEGLLDRAIELLLSPTLDNLRSLEDLLRQAIVRMPGQAGPEMARKVRLCGRLLEGAEAFRPGAASSWVYTAQGGQQRPMAGRNLGEV